MGLGVIDQGMRDDNHNHNGTLDFDFLPFMPERHAWKGCEDKPELGIMQEDCRSFRGIS